LTAIHTFFRYLSLIDESYTNQAKKILSIPIKRTHTKTVDYFEPEELNLLFKQINTHKPEGFRDMCILLLLYNTGARAQEIAGVKLSSLKLTAPAEVYITGKGNKDNIIPLFQETVRLLNIYIKRYRRKPQSGFEDYLFIAQRGKPITRFGIWEIVNKYIKKATLKNNNLALKQLSVHSFRHTTGTHQRQAGIDLNVRRCWLGHSDINTTAKYDEVDLNRKRQVLNKFKPPYYVVSFLDKETAPEQEKLDLDNWLKSL
jgi:site-specific recombinase XerD